MYKNTDGGKDFEELSLIEKILDAILQKIVLIIIVVVLALIGGYLYDRYREHSYTIYETINYTAKNTAEIELKIIDGKEVYSIKENSATHINTAKKYMSTVTGFFKTGVVVDRANFYYDQFYKELAKKYPSHNTQQVNDFLTEYIYTINGTFITNSILSNYGNSRFNVTFSDNTINPKNNCSFLRFDEEKLVFKDENGNEFSYRREGNNTDESETTIKSIVFSPFTEEYNNKKPKNNNILKANISASVVGEENFNFSLGYKDVNPDVAGIKVKIVALAANQEIKVLEPGYTGTTEEGKPIQYKYCNVVSISLFDLGARSTAIDISRKKILLMTGVGGFILGCVLVYLLSLLDASLTSKKDIEKITGVPLFTYIEEIKEEEKKNG